MNSNQFSNQSEAERQGLQSLFQSSEADAAYMAILTGEQHFANAIY